MPEKIIIFGAGGHAKVVIDAVERQARYEIAFLADADPSRIGSELLGYRVQSEEDAYSAGENGLRKIFVAIGNNATRRHIANLVLAKGLSLASVIHPSAVVAKTARIGAGTVVMPGSVINADANIGQNSIINSGAVIEHDSVVGPNSHIAPNATLCGGVKVGAGSLVGAGATVLVGVSIGNDVIVGAGSTVLANVPDAVHVVGTPARILARKS